MKKEDLLEFQKQLSYLPGYVEKKQWFNVKDVLSRIGRYVKPSVVLPSPMSKRRLPSSSYGLLFCRVSARTHVLTPPPFCFWIDSAPLFKRGLPKGILLL
jgi:hypothetical protein